MNVAVDYPWLLAAALALGALAAGAVWLETVRRRKRLARLGPASALERLLPHDLVHARVGRRPLWLAIAAVLAGIALAGPRWGAPGGAVESEGIDAVFAVDASLSMLATDESPNRLDRAKHEARRIRALSRGDRVGLIAFAGRSYILSPLTSDDGALALFLDNLDPSVVGQAGSSMSAAIRQGVDLLGPALGADRALVLFTDGETFDERTDVIAAARAARSAGVALVLVGFGTDEGSMIPIQVGEAAVAPKRDEFGQVVTTRYGRTLMRDVAEAAGGVVIEPEATDKASRVRAALSGLRTERRRVQARQMIPPRYHWFLAPALLLLMWDIYAANRRTRRAALVAASVLFAPVAQAQQARLLRDAERYALEQRPILAARTWKRALESGDRHPQTLYNLGTAYLLADSLDAAIEVLERASTMPAPALRNDALFNLGLAYLRRGLDTRGDAAATSFRGAVRAYRSVLLAAPADSAARWNYELAMKKMQQASASPSGGGGGQGSPPPDPSDQPLGRGQASQLLDAAARDERDAQGRNQRANRGTVVRGRDW